MAQLSELYVATFKAVVRRDVAAMRELLPAIQRLRGAASAPDASSSTQAPPASSGAVPRAPPAPAPLTFLEVASRHGPPLLQMLASEPHAANAQMAGMLLGAGEAADFPDGQPLHAAIMTGQPELVRILLDHGVNPNHTTVLGGNDLTPLHAAAIGEVACHHDGAAAAEICSMLLEHGADAMAGAGKAPLQLAAMHVQLAVVNALLAHGPAARMLEASSSDGQTALHSALSSVGHGPRSAQPWCRCCCRRAHRCMQRRTTRG